MDLEINCPHCSERLRVSTEHCGKEMSCASCGGAFVVPQAPAPVAPGARAREATGRQRREPTGQQYHDRQVHEREGTRPAHRRSHSSSPLVPVVLTLGVLGVLGFIGVSFYERSQEETSLFEAPDPDAPRSWSRAEIEPFVRLDSVAEKRYRNYVKNVYRADDSARGKKNRLENEQAMTDMTDHLFKSVLGHCNGVDLGMAQFVVDSILEEWRDDMERQLEYEGVERGGGFAVENAGERRNPSDVDDGLSAIQKEDRRLDQEARLEIREMLDAIEVPEAYESRSRWLSIELGTLRTEAAAGVNLNGFAYRVVRCEELFIFFHQWASEEERKSRSFSWVESNLNELRNLRDRWRAWSSGQSHSLDKARVEEELGDLVRTLERAETIFALH